MSTHRSTWKQAERFAASLFGARRQVGNTSGGRSDKSASDTDHPTLYIECKLRERHTVRTLHDDVREKARREQKTPVLVLRDKSRPGALIVAHTDHMDAVAAAWLEARRATGLPD
jgi:hypothetical protein